ncbi:hypothetical protein [Pseudomonas mediterranea]|uniref:hypothetical protein n=1 Tax=Pseudomonas mediterranea TaxID=183795 RepID=UPI001E05F098|nr:hypothetical protein [Pseudomonas mediterranea]CAH0152631.1 hypothetical protein SRABI112_00729 [Pseudomonas mediterranea]
MNFEQAKAMRIAAWRTYLDKHDFRMENPEAYRSHLHDLSASLAREGLIDRLEQFDMDDMANSAYWLALEELHANPIIYHSSYGYDVVPCGGGPRFGTIFHSILTLDKNRGTPLHTYDGKVYREKDGLVLNQSYQRPHGRIEGLVLTLTDGRQFDLIEKMSMVSGVIYEAIDDPDVYRWMLDVTQLAMENRNLQTMERIRPFFELAKFLRCDACRDDFGKRDDCASCDGRGFVPKPDVRDYASTRED